MHSSVLLPGRLRSAVATCRSTGLFLTLFLVSAMTHAVTAQERTIPDALKPWRSWATWNDPLPSSPTTYRSADEKMALWPADLSLSVDSTSGKWSFSVEVFAESWVDLPGEKELWPSQVRAGERVVPVVEREGRPAVLLKVGSYELSGEFSWDRMPQRIAVPPEIGVLSLTVNGQVVSIPRWDSDGYVWLQRIRAENVEKDLLAAQVYRVIEDGIPTQLLTEIEVTVSGKSREEQLGWILPDGFKISTINSPIPVAVDEQGRLKAQVRAGKWTISVAAFRSQNRSDIQYGSGAQPVIDKELVAFRAKPEFRLAEVEGVQTIDVTLTTFPEKWRQLPVYVWDTSTSFQLTEKMRGMGLQRPEGLSISRQFWLDEDGKSLTFNDQVNGRMQQIWRLDAAAGQSLGAVRIEGEGQLITENPQTGLQGVELRSRNVQLDAIGRIEDISQLSAAGWEADVDSLSATFILPPGWRALAVFGADRVEGDWLTAWSLLDLFLLLIFSMAAYRIWGFKAGIVAFFAFGLAYHEPGAPRWTWLFLLVPVALLRVVPAGAAKKLIQAWKYVAVGLLVVNLVPFVAQQAQTAIFPQLEIPGVNYRTRGLYGAVGSAYRQAQDGADSAIRTNEMPMQQDFDAGKEVQKAKFQSSNLTYDPATRIQTGPAQPQWSWNIVQCFWEGHVPAKQTIKPILLSLQMHRLLTLVRVLLVLLLAAFLLGMRRSSLPSAKAAAAVGCLLLVIACPETSVADEIPSQQMLETLRERLLQPSDVYPTAADIALAKLDIDDRRVRMEAEVHAAVAVAVPLPGKLPVWSPVAISIDDAPARFVLRKDSYLWVLVPKGVHKIAVESLLPDVSDWDWTFELKPRRVVVNAPGWTVKGIGRNGVPDQQLLFSRQQQATTSEAAYDKKDFNPIIAVERHLEIGLIWQVQTVVRRLSSDGKAASLKIPLLADESVLTSNVRVEDGRVDVALSSGQDQLSWTSEIPVGSEIQLNSSEDDTWIERWHLVTAPVWNMSQSGLAPVFEAHQENMVPVWYPWPGEQTTLKFTKPQAVSGAILTVQKVDHTVSMRQRDSTLQLEVECSIGSDFVVEIPADAAITSLMHDGQKIPVRRDAKGVLVAIRPGRQTIEVNWNTDKPVAMITDTGHIALPVEGSNVTTVMQVPDSRWVLWADGPLRGPAVRFWTILVTAVLVALVMGIVPNSPLRRVEWVLLALGLTQVPIAAALIVVAWLFVLRRRGAGFKETVRPGVFNLAQIGIVLLTFIALGVFVIVVAQGLLGHPDMFIVGNQSTRTYLKWFQPRIGTDLPVGRVVSVSVWFYRLLMLFWALWLANSLLRWLKWGWEQFGYGGLWKRKPKICTE